MQRRDVLKLLTSTAAFSALPLELMQGLQQARAQAGASSELRTLNQHRNATVISLSDLIIPETDTPGAKGAKVNEFIDLLLTEWFSESYTNRFLAGLDQVDATSRERFGSEFIHCNPAQQNQLVGQLDRDAMEYARRMTPAEKSNAEPDDANFFYTFKKLTLVGYYTSEIGFKQELGMSIIPPRYDACAPLGEAGK